MLALVDCNNFFVSCERLFRPDLERRPVVVLSSNDGCAVARSNEAKALGIPMGAPAFKYRELFAQHSVVQCSANFELYSNISRRVTAILCAVTPRTEIYSIDEAFLDIAQLGITDPTAWGRQLRAKILREVGIPVSIGVAPTKTLAKLASEIAKKNPRYHGVTWCHDTNREELLAATQLGDVWGIGRHLRPRLYAEGVTSALQFAQMRPQHAQQLMGIRGRQMVAELGGTRCFALEPLGTIHKSIMRGRTFGEDTNDSTVVHAAIATLATQAVFRLRAEGQAGMRAGIFIETSRHKPGYRRWYREVHFPAPELDTGTVIQALSSLFTGIYAPRQQYHRVNIFLFDFVPIDRVQTDILGTVNIPQHERSTRRMRAVDTINARFGRGHIRYASEDLSSAWRPKRQLRSPQYVTNWHDLPTTHIT